MQLLLTEFASCKHQNKVPGFLKNRGFLIPWPHYWCTDIKIRHFTRKAAQPCCAWPDFFFLLFVLYEILFDACDSCGCIVHKEPLPDWWFCAMQAADCFVEGVSALGYLIWSASFCIQNHVTCSAYLWLVTLALGEHFSISLCAWLLSSSMFEGRS